jgi:hypothetical protein
MDVNQFCSVQKAELSIFGKPNYGEEYFYQIASNRPEGKNKLAKADTF